MKIMVNVFEEFRDAMKYRLQQMWGDELEAAKNALFIDPRSKVFLGVGENTNADDIELAYLEHQNDVFCQKVDFLTLSFEYAADLKIGDTGWFGRTLYETVITDTQKELMEEDDYNPDSMGNVLRAIEDYSWKLMGAEFSRKHPSLS